MTPAASPALDAGALLTPEQKEKLAAWKKRYPYPRMGLIEALREVQGWHRCVSLEAEAFLAELFELPAKSVHEVATFYPYFTQSPCGRNRIAVCHNLSCTLAGAKKTLKAFEVALGVGEGETTPDGAFTLEAVECIGACEQAPAVAVNDELLGRVEAAEAPSLVPAIREIGAAARAPAPAFVWSPGSGEDLRLLTRHFDREDLHTLAGYRAVGGYAALAKALQMKPAEIVEEVESSNLRGLGGAGFPVGFKWSTVPPKDKGNKPHFLVVNADESEPGCFKDRVLLERSPHQVLEGALIAARAVDADWIVVFLRGEYAGQYRILEAAIAEARQAGLLNVDVTMMRGAGAYISGADTALMETMEGKKAWPRQPPPFPTVAGVMGCPTVVNNVETLAMVPHIIARGGQAFAELGHGKSGGTAVYSVSGHVARPGIYEFPMGTPLKALLDAAGGVAGGRKLKAVIPGGTSTPVLRALETDVRLEFDSMRGVGSFLGAGGVVVLDETTDLVEVLYVIERFLWHESCGQCTPCREGSGWLTRILKRILDGQGVPADLKNIDRVSENITGKVICALGDTVGMVSKAMLAKFWPEFEARVAAPPDGHGS